MMSWFQCMFFFIVILSVNCSAIEMESTTQSLANRVAAEIQRMLDEIEKEEDQLEVDRQTLKKEKQILNSVNHIDVLRLNVGGEIFGITRQTLTKIHKSILSVLFNGRWEYKLQIDQNGNIFFDFNPVLFRHLLDQLQTLDSNNQIQLFPPSQPSLVKPFKKMLRKLALDQLLSPGKKNVITFNVGGQTITNRRATFAAVSNSTSDTILPPSQMINFNNESDVFLDYDPKIFRHLINQLREEPVRNISFLGLGSNDEKISFQTMLTDLSIYQQHFNINQTWKQNATTTAGGHGPGNQLNQLYYPCGFFIDDDQTIYVADTYNDRIVEWKKNAINGQIVVGGNGSGNRNDQLSNPAKVIIDQENDSLIICDRDNRRVVSWPRRNGQSGEILISNIRCWDLMMDNDGYLYVSDIEKHEVRRWKMGETNGTIVAGGNGGGNRLDQFNGPYNILIDEDHSVYASDHGNHRAMKWMKGAKEGIVVAGGQGIGNGLRQLSYPHGIIVDQLGSVYVADYGNDRVIHWLKGAAEGMMVVGGNVVGEQPNQLNGPIDLSFDRENNLYVVDWGNHRVPRFDVN